VNAGRRGSLSLRWRVLATFAVGSILLVGIVSVVTYTVSRTYLLRQRRAYATRVAAVDARLIDSLTRDEPESVARAVDSLENPANSIPFLYRDGRWYSGQTGVDEHLIPGRVRDAVLYGRGERDLTYRAGGPKLAVGIPLRDRDGYFEVFPLHELARTLSAVRLALLAAALATLVGSLALGRFAFNGMVEKLNAQVERDARFAANISHELRSPLTTLKTAVEGMHRRRDHLDERSQRLLTLLVEEVDRFEGLVTDLLEISRMDDARPGALRRQDTTVAELMESVTARLDLGATAATVVGQPSAVVRVDARRMERIVANLVRNAETHGRGLAGVRAVVDGNHVRLEIEDRGAGVPPEDRERVFERFYRRSAEAGQRRSGDGVGLGLALVAQHVRLHDGRVWVEDAEPNGARFVVELPVSGRSL
jgi:two-component system, OmpR family, sensor histidine kinase MtrB